MYFLFQVDSIIEYLYFHSIQFFNHKIHHIYDLKISLILKYY